MKIAASRSWVALCLGIAFAAGASAGTPGGKESAERLKADVYHLASGTLEGRGVETPGVELAARHVRAEFTRVGLKSGVPDGSYFQPFPRDGVAKADPKGALCNVIGVLEGKGDLAGETVVVGAHYDHLGRGPFGSLAPEADRRRVHPGADDNASGVAAVLELARRFAPRDAAPRRRLVFVAFGAEEAGRVGSRHYVSKEPLFPIRDTVAMVNFDMVGRLRDNQLGIAGNESAAEFGGLLAGAAAGSPLKLMLGGPEYPDDSDHASFAAAGVPILYLCTGSHGDRHTPADTADKVDYDGLAAVVDFSENVLDRLLVMPRPRFVPPPRKSSPPDSK